MKMESFTRKMTKIGHFWVKTTHSRSKITIILDLNMKLNLGRLYIHKHDYSMFTNFIFTDILVNAPHFIFQPSKLNIFCNKISCLLYFCGLSVTKNHFSYSESNCSECLQGRSEYISAQLYNTYDYSAVIISLIRFDSTVLCTVIVHFK